MSDATDPPPDEREPDPLDVVEQVRRLDPERIRQRIRELDAERAALMRALRLAMAARRKRE